MDKDKILLYESLKAKPLKIWLLFLFFGWSYGALDKIGLQILFYLSFAGFGIWGLVRLLTLNDAIEVYNRKIADQLGLFHQEIAIVNIS